MAFVAWRGRELTDWLARAVGVIIVLFALGPSSASLRGDRPLSAPAPARFFELRVRAVGEGPSDGAFELQTIVGLDVRLFRERQGRYEYVAQALTDAVGTATLRVPAGTYWVIGRATGFARASFPLEVSADRELEIALSRAEAIAIEVRSGAEPVARATVLVTGADALPLAGATDGAGRLELDGLSGGSYRVRVVGRGYEPFETTTSGPELEVQLRRSLGLRVTVKDARGVPVGGAEVQLGGAQLWPTRRIDTNDRGEVLISGLSAGSYDLLARQGGRASELLRGVELRQGSAEVQSVELVLREGRFLPVQVVDGEGQAIAGADLVLAEAGVSSFPVATRTGAEGTARVGPLLWPEAHLTVRADGFVPRALWVGAEARAPDEPLRIELLRGGTLEGRVLDEAGYPVEGASLEVIGTDLYGMPVSLTPETSSVRKAHFAQVLEGPRLLVPAGELGVMPGPVPPLPLGAGALAVAAPNSFTTDGRGGFRTEAVSPGELRVLVRHPEFVDSVSEPVRLGAGGRAELEVVLRAGRRLVGRLLDARDFPVGFSRVRFQASRGAFDRTLLTQSDGTFALPVVPKDLWVSVYDPGDALRVVLRRSVKLSDDPTEQLELVLPEARPDARLEVVDERGDPVAVAQVTVLSLDPEVPLRETRFSAGDGALELRAAAGLHARVLVDAPGFARLDAVFRELPEAGRLRLQGAVTVTGRVTAVRGRQPAPGARVVLRGESQRRETRTSATGEYTLHDLAPGHFTLSVEHDELGRGGLEIRVVRLDHDRPFEVPVVDLVEPGSVRGRVVDTQGAPVEGARVAVGLVPSYLPRGALPSGVVLTDSTGEFFLPAVEPGRPTLSAQAPGVGRGSVRGVAVTAGDELSDVTIRLTEPVGEDAHDFRGGVAITLGEGQRGRGSAVVVVHVAEASEAERAGIELGDLITHVDGVAVTTLLDTRERLGGPAGSDVLLGLLRGGAPLSTRVTREALSR